MKKTLLLISMAFLIQAPACSAADFETMNWLKPREIAASVEPGKPFKDKKGGALSRSASLFRLAFIR